MAVSRFDVYRLPAEHEAVREAVPAVCDGKVAPNAAAADENGEFPQASYDALRAVTATPRTSPSSTAARTHWPPR
ncbi:MAG: hypothetical protein QOE03_921 [Micromonosporaceae bacterium]|nr:hypothetical protein [Micromonosporaceae bacterium]